MEEEKVQKKNDDTDVSDGEDEKKPKMWCEVIPLDNSKFKPYQCFDKEITIGRAANNKMIIDDKRLSGNHCKLILQNKTVLIEDLSTNGTYIFDKKIGKGLKSEIGSGDIVYVLHKTKVAAGEVIGFVVKLAAEDNKQKEDQQRQVFMKEEEEKMKKRRLEDDAKIKMELQKMKEEHEEEKKKIQEELKKFKSQDDKISEELECVICMDIIYSCVTLQPCLHNLCAACYYDWKQKSDECPNCRTKVVDYAKNPTLNNLIAQVLEKNPNKKNSEDYYKMMEEKSKLLWGTANNAPKRDTLKIPEQKPSRGSSPVAPPPPPPPPSRTVQKTQQKKNNKNICRECKAARDDDGFQCAEDTKHVTCNACKKEFPDRGDDCDNQKCILCDLFFCNIYTKTCKQKRFLLAGNYLDRVRDRTPPAFIPLGFFRNNQIESRVLSQYLTMKKLSTQNLFNEVLNNEMKAGKFFYEISPKWDSNEKNTKRIQIREITPVCSTCFNDKLWFQIVVNYRIKIAKELPPPYNIRGQCWYGLNCRTQNQEHHAKKLDHICEQTKF